MRRRGWSAVPPVAQGTAIVLVAFLAGAPSLGPTHVPVPGAQPVLVFPPPTGSANPRLALLPLATTLSPPAPLSPLPRSVGGVSAKGWYEIPRLVAPSPRTFMEMAYEPAYGGLILFGGHLLGQAPLNDTWLFANGSWTNLTTSFTVAPSPRWGDMLTWDPAAGSILLFGGRDDNGGLADTWEFNSSGWHQLNPSASPSARGFAQMFYDASSGAVILEGGGCPTCHGGGWIDYNDTWAFAKGQWTNITKNVGVPPPLLQNAFADWDPVDGAGVVYGGGDVTKSCVLSNQTYAYTGGWNRTGTGATPANLTAGGGAWDAVDGFFLVNGGLTYTPRNSSNSYCNPQPTTWGFVNGSWTNLSASLGGSTPNGRCCQAVGYDPVARQIVMFGGNDYGATSNSAENETWVFPAPPLVGSQINLTAGAQEVGVSLAFNAGVSGGLGTYSFNWSFGDGTANGTQAQPTHTFSASGTYTVSVEVRDSQNRSVNLSKRLVIAPALSVGISANRLVGDVPLTVAFASQVSGGVPPMQYSWNFGDGSGGSTAAAPNHIFSATGTFNVTLSVTDSANVRQTQSVLVRVYGALSAILASNPSEGTVPFAVVLNSTATGGLTPYTYNWTFGDGNTSAAGAAVAHTYTVAGTYTVFVTVTDAAGGSAIASTTVAAYAPLGASPSASPGAGLAPLTVQFNANPTGGVPPVTGSWTFGDGSPAANQPVVTHTYATTGIFTASYTEVDSQGHSYTTSLVIQVVQPLAVHIGASSNLAPVGMTIALVAEPVGGLGPLDYLWTFGDGTTSTLAAVNHSYARPGSFVVTLKAADALGESSSSTFGVTVFPRLQIASSPPEVNGTVGEQVTLAVTVSGGYGAISLVWGHLPPGCVSENATALTCSPSASGTYTVRVNASDESGETASATLNLTVQPTGGSGGPGPIEYGVVAAVVGVGGAAAIGWVVLRRRARRPPEGADEGEEGEPATPEPNPVGPDG